MNDDLAMQIEEWAQGYIDSLSPAEQKKITRLVAFRLRKNQQQRVRKQKNPDGESFKARRRPRKVEKMKFLYKNRNGEVKTHQGKASGQSAKDRFVMWEDDKPKSFRYSRILEVYEKKLIKEKAKQRMFNGLIKAKFLKITAIQNRVDIGFKGVASRIATVHQFGLQEHGIDYPERQILGLSSDDEEMIMQVIQEAIVGNAG